MVELPFIEVIETHPITRSTGLTGTAPTPHETGSTAGISHEWHIKTRYYETTVPIWVDQIEDVEEWKAEFLKPEAREVIDAVGAWIYCFRAPSSTESSHDIEATMKAVQEICEQHSGYGAETAMLAVAVPDSKGGAGGFREIREEWDDISLQYGFELVEHTAEGKNEFGEKVGLERLKEALEANEWAATTTSGDEELVFRDDDLAENEDDHFRGFARDEAEMTAELFGMKAALNGNDLEPDTDVFSETRTEEAQVEDLDRLMGRLLAVREQSADLPEAQRKRLAAKAVRELFTEGEAP